MPYEEVMVYCRLLYCINNEEGYCTCECKINELTPHEDSCEKFLLHISPVTCENEEQVEKTLEIIKDYDIPFVSLDEQSMNFGLISISRDKYVVVRSPETMKERLMSNIDDIDIEALLDRI